MINEIEAKSILSKLKGEDSFFGLSYNMNIYRGCQHGCIYCDTRSECYGVGDISKISLKRNALELLKKELASKRRQKGSIGTGSMNDPYMPIEEKTQMVRNALSIIAEARYPVHVITKSSLVMRDSDILQQISTTYAAVSLSITTFDNQLASKLEPHASSTSSRLETIKHLSDRGIYTGVTLMPLLPYINDNTENIIRIIRSAKDAGAKYIIPMFGVTLRKGSRDYLYQCFDRQFTGMREKYQQTFDNNYICNSPNWRLLNDTFISETYKLDIPVKMNFYKNKNNNTQLSLF